MVTTALYITLHFITTAILAIVSQRCVESKAMMSHPRVSFLQLSVHSLCSIAVQRVPFQRLGAQSAPGVDVERLDARNCVLRVLPNPTPSLRSPSAAVEAAASVAARLVLPNLTLMLDFKP